MSIDVNAIKELVKYSVRQEVPTNFENIASLTDVEETIRSACNELASTKYEYERNKTYIFEIIQTAIDEVLPKKVLATVGQFAEVKQFANQEIARFKIKKGRNRAKRFVTKAAIAGIYETFRMDHSYIDVTCNAYGGAADIDFERYLSGDEDFAEYTAIMMEGLEDAIYKEIMLALENAATQLTAVDGGQGSNYAIIAGSDGVLSTSDIQALNKIVTTAKRYGNGSGASIWGTEPVLQLFTNNVGGTNFTPNVPTSDLEEIKDRGFIGKWKGNSLIELPNSFEDETNTSTVFKDCYGFVFPNGRDIKVVKIALEGPTQVDDYKRRDRSMEIQAYKKFGVAIVTYNDWCMFKVSSLA